MLRLATFVATVTGTADKLVVSALFVVAASWWPRSATWFGVEGLMSAGEPVESPTITKAVDFMLRSVLDST